MLLRILFYHRSSLWAMNSSWIWRKMNEAFKIVSFLDNHFESTIPKQKQHKKIVILCRWALSSKFLYAEMYGMELDVIHHSAKNKAILAELWSSKLSDMFFHISAVKPPLSFIETNHFYSLNRQAKILIFCTSHFLNFQNGDIIEDLGNLLGEASSRVLMYIYNPNVSRKISWNISIVKHNILCAGTYPETPKVPKFQILIWTAVPSGWY